MEIIYLDNAATTPPDPAVQTAMRDADKKYFANPSSIHSLGQGSKVALENARSLIAETLGAGRSEIVFTSGGTESDNMALITTALANRDRGRHIITTQIEHPAVLETCSFLERIGFSVTYVEAMPDGNINLDQLAQAIQPETFLISVMMANNETGCILPLREIAELIKNKNIYLHTDAVQVFGRLDIHVDELGVDLLSLSAHKIYGPKGVGLLYVRAGTKSGQFLHGGGQESRRRGGTENLTGIIGFAEAVEQLTVKKEERRQIQLLRDLLEHELKAKIPGIRIHGEKMPRLVSHSLVHFPFIKADALLVQLDLQGIAVSAGSACSSGSAKPSHVLTAMKIPADETMNSLRISVGRFNTIEEIQKVVTILQQISERTNAQKNRSS